MSPARTRAIGTTPLAATFCSIIRARCSSRRRVVVEVCQLLAARQGTEAEAAFLATLGSGGLSVVDLERADYTRAAALVTQYADLPLGAVDAAVVAVAERLRIVEIATLDRRHFTVVRPAHVDAFTLLPDFA